MQKEMDVRRAAYGLIPQLPRDHEDALAVLDYADAVIGIGSMLGRENRRLAADLAMLLPEDLDEARRAIAFARAEVKENLDPGGIARDVGEEVPAAERLRLVVDR